jgi:uncharacterized cupredoxin-like copper-binding protein
VIEDTSGKKVGGLASILPEGTDQLLATLRSGNYIIVCDLPGHRDAGMHGKLTVRD